MLSKGTLLDYIEDVKIEIRGYMNLLEEVEFGLGYSQLIKTLEILDVMKDYVREG